MCKDLEELLRGVNNGEFLLSEFIKKGMFMVSKSNHQTVFIYIESPFTLRVTGKKDQDIYEDYRILGT